MKAMDNRGFSLVEILVVIVIIGLLSSVAITALTRYLVKSREQAYSMMSENASYAAENYFLDHVGVSEVEISELVSEQYLEPTYDPSDKETQCGGTVYKTLTEEDEDSLAEATYKVVIDCSGTIHDFCRIYPGGNSC